MYAEIHRNSRMHAEIHRNSPLFLEIYRNSALHSEIQHYMAKFTTVVWERGRGGCRLLTMLCSRRVSGPRTRRDHAWRQLWPRARCARKECDARSRPRRAFGRASQLACVQYCQACSTDVIGHWRACKPGRGGRLAHTCRCRDTARQWRACMSARPPLMTVQAAQRIRAHSKSPVRLRQ